MEDHDLTKHLEEQGMGHQYECVRVFVLQLPGSGEVLIWRSGWEVKELV